MQVFKKIGKYQYSQRHCLGEGSFGKVYQGRDQNGSKIAIKKVQQKLLFDPYLKQSLNTQIAIMKKLKHKNIVDLLDTVITANSIYLIMQFCSGGDLKRYCTNKKLEQKQAKNIITQIVQGFQIIVKQGIIHRDLKPANILVHQGTFKICDFGFAKFFGDNAKMAKTCVGTPIYMSPQVLKQKPYTSKTDVWSLGVVYYELLFKKLPFVGRSEQQIFNQISKGKLQFSSCSPFSSIFLQNTLIVQQKDRWDWKKVFQHFQMKQFDLQKPNFYRKISITNSQKPNNYQRIQNNFKQQIDKGYEMNNISNTKPKQKIKFLFNYNVKQNDQNDDSPKLVKPHRMAKNQFAMINSNDVRGDQNIFNKQTDNKENQTQKHRYFYFVLLQFIFNPKPMVPSFPKFIYSLFRQTIDGYQRQISVSQNKSLKKTILIQQKLVLQKIQPEIQRTQYVDLRTIATFIQLQGKQFFTKKQIQWLKFLSEQ